MKEGEEGKEVDTSSSEVLQDFLAWQCRLRQEAMRGGEGRPSEGMMACVLEPEPCLNSKIIFLLHREDAHAYVSQFRFIVQSSFDPKERRDHGLKVLSSTYYQNSPIFRSVVTAVFPEGSDIAKKLCRAGKVRFSCHGGGLGFEVMGSVEELKKGDALREGSLWHNRLFAAQGEQCVVGVWIEGVVRRE